MHVSHEIACRNREVGNVMQGHLSEVRVTVINEEVTESLLQWVAKDDQTIVIAKFINWSEGHIFKSFKKCAASSAIPVAPFFILHNVVCSSSGESVPEHLVKSTGGVFRQKSRIFSII